MTNITRMSHALKLLLPLIVVLLLGAIFNANGSFFVWATHRALLREISVYGMLACGMTLVIVTGGIDLSVGSVLALSAVSFALATLHLGWSAVAAIAAVSVLGLVCGLLSGGLVAWARIPAFIGTLALMVFARGLAKQLSDGQKISTYRLGADGQFQSLPAPPVFEAIDARVFGGQLSVVTLIFIACVVITWLTLERLRIGRYLLAVGGNWEAARLSGVPVRLALYVAYGLSGLFAAVAGICQAAQETQGDPETGLGYELDAIAMVVLGGTRLSGGRGGVGRTVLGVLTLGYLQKVLSLNAFSTEARLMLTGLILIVAVLVQRKLERGGSVTEP